MKLTKRMEEFKNDMLEMGTSENCISALFNYIKTKFSFNKYTTWYKEDDLIFVHVKTKFGDYIISADERSTEENAICTYVEIIPELLNSNLNMRDIFYKHLSVLGNIKFTLAAIMHNRTKDKSFNLLKAKVSFEKLLEVQKLIPEYIKNHNILDICSWDDVLIVKSIYSGGDEPQTIKIHIINTKTRDSQVFNLFGLNHLSLEELSKDEIFKSLATQLVETRLN